MRSTAKTKIDQSPKAVEFITIVSTQREVTEDNTTSIYVFNTTDKKKAWEHLKEDIKNLGDYEVEIKLYSGITAHCTISVEKV